MMETGENHKENHILKNSRFIKSVNYKYVKYQALEL
jgi:hypothetical protein